MQTLSESEVAEYLANRPSAKHAAGRAALISDLRASGKRAAIFTAEELEAYGIGGKHGPTLKGSRNGNGDVESVSTDREAGTTLVILTQVE